ncbi:HD domain-containing protein [uncultured Corynebacterium sp.]|uniref:HD domain-containing protein n=1 Tax=uncultured Corynebacterium sp. TaxID=159447 RepID=UPI0025F9AC37|nr:HD domain-containing protein [uncultured Corynebacterium sp.]
MVPSIQDPHPSNSTSASMVTRMTPRLMKAIDVAAVAHRHHVRKMTETPYVAHLFAVALLVAEFADAVAVDAGADRDGEGSPEDLIIAALLHDTLEDVPEHYDEDRMRADFGDRVTGIVGELTKIDDPSWQVRSENYLRHLEHQASVAAVVVSACDKMHNLKSTLIDLEAQGTSVWERFNAGRDKQLWWYSELARVYSARLSAVPGCGRLTGEFADLVERLHTSF